MQLELQLMRDFGKFLKIVFEMATWKWHHQGYIILCTYLIKVNIIIIIII